MPRLFQAVLAWRKKLRYGAVTTLRFDRHDYEERDDA